MKIISTRQQEESMKYLMGILAIIEDIPIDALGNSADGVAKMSKLYYMSSEIAYTLNGVNGLNQYIESTNNRTRNMDEILAVSKAHIRTISNHTKRRQNKK